MIELNLENVIKEIKKRKAKTVLLQLPEGLKIKTNEIVEKIESKTNATVIVDVSPCFGACDIPESEAKNLGADLIVHFGHTEFYKTKFPTIYVPLNYRISEQKIESNAEKLIEFLKNKKIKKIALCTTAQYLAVLGDVKKAIERNSGKKNKANGKNKIKVFIGKGIRVKEGQLLGCNFSSIKAVEKNIDGIVFLGDGVFHPQIACFGLNKPVILLNLFDEKIEELSNEHEKFLRKRFALIELAKNAKSFAILVSTKNGQNRKDLALKLKKEIEKNGKKAIILSSDLIKSEYFLGLKFDALVDTACPRIAFDDSMQFKQPIITPMELEIVLGQHETKGFHVHQETNGFLMKKKWEDFEVKEFY